jgi:NAD(P)-dependent dehydrogenase (short-subunit alcohol dehydrogenase family)
MGAMRIPTSPFRPGRDRERTSVAGKTVLITGGAVGIGAGLGRELARRGARVVLTDMDEPGLEQTRSQIAAESGESSVLTLVADVCSLTDMERAVSEGVSRFGGIDVVVANAGIAPYGSVAGIDPAMFRRVIDVNVTGVFHTVRASLASLVERRGYVLVVSSLAAFVPAPGLAAYNASKAGAEHFANALRVETAHQGVAVGSAHMSWIDTPMVRDARRDLGAFDEMIQSLSPPMNRTTDLETCVDAFVDGIENRARTVFVPQWVGAIGRARVLASRLGAKQTQQMTPDLLPRMDEEVRRLGRSASDRIVQHQPTNDVEGV